MVLEQTSPGQSLDEALAAFLKAAEAGAEPDRAALLADHPEWGEDLREFFAGLEQLERIAAPLRGVRSAAVAGTDGGPSGDTVDDPLRTGPFQPRPAPSGAAVPTAAEISGYEILGVLGRGGMGVVYQARHVRLRRLVALKMIRAGDQADEADLARFRVEAEAVARLQHPNIVQIYEVGEHAGQPFCALEFVPGGTLAAHLGGTPQPPRMAAALVRTLARGVEAAHRSGIIHRDLKPANILLAEDGSPKITDFGLAKRLDDDTGQTRTGAVMGTPAYMAPEQALGRGKEVGPAADVYALGAILYECLVGLPPFKGASVLETLEQVRTREPVAVRLLQPKVPRDLETVCLKCLQKDPRKRYASAAALAEDLDRWLDGRPIQARRSRAWERAYRWVRRNPVVSGLGLLVAIALLVGFLGVAWQLRQTKIALAEAKTNLYVQRVNLADREAQAGNTDRADVLLDLCPPELRHWEWHYLKRRCHVNWVRLAGHTDLVRGVALNADGSRLASCGNDGTVRIWDSATGHELHTLGGHNGWVSAVVFSADGRRLVSASENGIVKVWDPLDGRELQSRGYGAAYVVTLSPDGRLLALLRGEGMTVQDLGTGAALTTIAGRLPPHGKAVAFSYDGQYVAAPLGGGLRIWEARTGRPARVLSGSLPQGVYSMTFSRDGRRLYGSQNVDRYPALKVWDTVTGKEEVDETLSTALTVSVMALSPDGRMIATGGHEGTVKVRDTVTGKDLRVMRTFDDAVGALAFRPDGRGLAVAAGRDVWVRGWGNQGQGPAILKGHDGGVSCVAFSPDGSRLASCGDKDQVQVWDARTHQHVIRLSAPAPGYTAVAFSPDGRGVLATGRDGVVYTWEAGTGRPGTTLQVSGSELRDATYSPDGRRIGTAGSDKLVRLWEADTGREVRTCTGHEAAVWSVRFSPDGRRLGSASSDGTVRLWDADTGREDHVLRGHVSHVQGVAFSPDGRQVASSSTDETVRLWDVAAGRPAGELRGHTGPVHGLSFSSDGRRLASASEDGTVRLWDVATAQEAFSLPESGKVRWVAFSPDGRYLGTAGPDHTVKLWDATPMENP